MREGELIYCDDALWFYLMLTLLLFNIAESRAVTEVNLWLNALKTARVGLVLTKPGHICTSPRDSVSEGDREKLFVADSDLIRICTAREISPKTLKTHSACAYMCVC